MLLSPIRELDLDLLHILNLDVNCTHIEDIEDAKAKAAKYQILTSRWSS